MTFQFIIYIHLILSILSLFLCKNVSEYYKLDGMIGSQTDTGFYVAGLLEKDSDSVKQRYQGSKPPFYVYQYNDNERMVLTCVKKYRTNRAGRLEWTFNDELLKSTVNLYDATMWRSYTFILKASDDNSTIKCTHTYKTETKHISIKLTYNKTLEMAAPTEDIKLEISLTAGSVLVTIIIVIIYILCGSRNKRNKGQSRGIDLTSQSSERQESNPQRIENGQTKTHNETYNVNTIHNNETSENDALYENIAHSYNKENTEPELNYTEIMLTKNKEKFQVKYSPEYAQIMTESVQANCYNNYVNAPYPRYVNGNVGNDLIEPAYCELGLQARD